MNIDEFLEDLSDESLLAACREAQDDLAEAANTEPNSEWHEACFAGLVVLTTEMTKRGLRISAPH
ncbi:MAG TPA: hypothetical protein VIT92_08955 [Burkholderiaceae bacterium]